MSSAITAEDAVQALTAAWQEDSQPSTGQDNTQQVQPPSEGQTQDQSNQEAEKPSGLFYDVDPESLTPDMRRMFDGMNASYTQRQQELAEQRKQIESLGDFERVQQAVQFVDSLNDPQNLVQLHTELSDYLQAAGYSKGDADQAAAAAIQETQPNELEADYGLVDPEVAALKKEIDDLSSWRKNFEEQRELEQYELNIQRVENTLRQEQGYDDAAIARIYQLAWSTGGDLNAAADVFEGMKKDFLTSYVNTKAEVPAVSPVSAGLGQIPESFGSDFEAAHRHAKRIAIAAQNNGEFDS